MEFKCAEKDVERLTSDLLGYDGVLSAEEGVCMESLAPVHEGLAAMAVKVEALEAIAVKMDGKMDEKDPVTGTSRFGPVMRTRVKEYALHVAALREQMSERTAVCSSLVEAARARKQAEENSRRVKELEALAEEQALEEARAEETRRKDEAEAAARALQKAADEAVRDQAAFIRDRKLAEVTLEAQRDEDAFNVTVSEVSAHNALPKGLAPFEAALGVLAGGEDAEAGKTALATIADILDNIMAKPDHETFRRLKTSSQLLRQRLLDSQGAMEALAACGFRATIEKPDNYPVQPAVVLLTMSEPNPEADVSAWMEWFDGLKEKRDAMGRVQKYVGLQ